MKSVISYFIKNHLLSNVIFFGIILLGIFSWKQIGKEEMPEFASNWVRISTFYPGAPAEDVELFLTKPIEDELKGVVGIEEIQTTSSVGSSSIRIVLDDDYPDKDEVLQEIKDAVFRVNLPSEVRDLPNIRQFKSSEKAILDIGIYHKDKKTLTTKSRQELQKYIHSFESQLLSLQEISSISRSHYLKPELQILVDPKEKIKSKISLSEIRSQIIDNNVRVPIGSMNDRGESKVTALNELDTVDSLNSLVLRGNYEGNGILLGEIASIKEGFEKSDSIFKINGHEGVFLNIKKSLSTDILSAKAAVDKFIKEYQENNSDSPIAFVLMDDESFAVRNRLNIIGSNGVLGFILIVIVLFVFLDFKSGFWVAMGIPFTMSFTIILATLFGYTVNNMTLAGIIIVLGIVVDDAIIVAENIIRKKEEGLNSIEAAIEGTSEVFKPIIASIVTTCVAFIPLIFFEGFFGKLVAYIPLVVILMLKGSLFESLFILPGHIMAKNKFLDSKKETKENWFYKYEKIYENFLLKSFHFKFPILIGFVVLLLGSIYIFNSKMNYVMFPREESSEVFIKIKVDKSKVRQETSKIIEPLELYLANDKENVVGVRSSIALSRRGGQVKENEASILVEVFPADQRKTSLNKLLEKWEAFAKDVKDLKEVKFLRGRWGNDTGSALEIQILENNDRVRNDVSQMIIEEMKKSSRYKDTEIEDPMVKKEFLFKLKQDNLVKFGVSPNKVTSILRSFVEGSILYSVNKGDEEVDVRLTVPEDAKKDLTELLNLRVENNSGSLVYLKNIVEIQEIERPVNIKRADFKRMTMIYSNIVNEKKTTPLLEAEYIEKNIFPIILKKYPTTILKFKGEVEDSRKSQGEFTNSIYLVLLMIYFILIIMFNNLYKPLLVLAVVPFGVSGLIYVLLFHGMSIFGFFAVIGALGMVGVIINDSIIMIDKIESILLSSQEKSLELIAKTAATRLRPVVVTTLTTVVGVLPTAYGFAGYDSMLAEMMLALGWGLFLGTVITLILIPCLYTFALKYFFAKSLGVNKSELFS